MKVSKTALAVVVALMASSLWADVYTFKPATPDLSDLPHQSFFTWAIKWALPEGQTITSATLTYQNIWDWTREADRLYTHLLDRPADKYPNLSYQTVNTGAYSYQRATVIGTDNQLGGDNFASWPGSQVVLLMPDGTPYWNDPVGGAARNFDLVYDLTGHSDMLADGAFGFGIDPDCHYFNTGITLTIETERVSTPPVPAPAAVGLAAVGLAMVFWGRWYSKRHA